MGKEKRYSASQSAISDTTRKEDLKIVSKVSCNRIKSLTQGIAHSFSGLLFYHNHIARNVANIKRQEK